MSPVRRPDWGEAGGTSGFSPANDDLRPFFDPKRRNLSSIPLGINSPGSNLGAVWDTRLLKGHGLCIAPNATGKSASVAIPASMFHGGSLFSVDIKEEICDRTYHRRQAMGQRVVKFAPWNRNSSIKATRYNPLTFINPKSPEYFEDVTALEDAVIITHPGENPHWPDSSRGYFGGFVCLAKEIYGLKATLRHVRHFMHMEPAEVIPYLAAAKRRFPNSLANRKLNRYITLSNDEIESVRSTALTQTAFLDDDTLQDAMENDTPVFNLDEFVTRPTTIWACLPPDKLITYGRWLRIIIALLLRSITRARVLPTIPHLLLIDEMGTIGPLRCVESAYSVIRSYEARLFGFYQSYGQILRDYPASAQNLVGNCSIFQVLGARDHETATYVSELLGTTTVRPPLRTSILEMMEAPNPAFYYIMQDKKRREEMGQARPIMYPHEVTALLGDDPSMGQNTQLICYLQGGRKVLTLQNPYFRERRWKGMYR